MMTATSRKEMNKLREVVHFLLTCTLENNAVVTPGGTRIVCYFCRKNLMEDEEWNKHGNSTGPKLAAKITIHHIDDNHDNNVDENKALCHRSCHKGYHRRIANEQRTLVRRINRNNLGE